MENKKRKYDQNNFLDVMIDLIDVPEMGRLLRTDALGVHRRVNNGSLPKPIHIGRQAYWRRVDFAEWLEKEAINQGSVITSVRSGDILAINSQLRKPDKSVPPKEIEAKLAKRRRGRPSMKEQRERLCNDQQKLESQ